MFRCVSGNEGRHFVFQFCDDAQREFGADAVRLGHGRFILCGNDLCNFIRRYAAEDRKANFRTHALHGGEELEPILFLDAGKTEEVYRIFAHMCLNQQRGGFSDRKLAQRVGGASDGIAHTLHIQDNVVAVDAVHEAFEFCEH